MKRRVLRTGSLITLLVLLAACSLPRSAPGQAELLAPSARVPGDFALYSVNRALLPKVALWPRTGGAGSSGWIAHQKGSSSAVIAAGDRLNLLIWDSDQNSLLTAPGQKNVVMNEVKVSPDGTVFVPYLDRIAVAGMSPDAARKTIQTQLGAIISSAQVQLSLLVGRGNAVDLVGGVAKAGNYPLPGRNFTVLGLISAGGGVSAGLRNPQVRLQRGGRLYTTSIARLYQHPALDTTLVGGDKVIVAEDARYFLALGAAGTQKLTYFQKDQVSALDAMSIMGGISETRADPKGILILRTYPTRAVRADERGPTQTRVVFSIDLTTADGLFSAGQFKINPKDLVLVTESPVTSVQKVFNLIGSALGIANKV